MKSLLRILIGAVGVLALTAALASWLMPAKIAGGLGLALADPTGTATIRAQVAGFFAAWGSFALLGAMRARADAVLVSISLMTFALFGRLINVILTGWDSTFLPPLAIEILTLALFALAYRALRNQT